MKKMLFHELEYKYSAESISLTSFITLMTALKKKYTKLAYRYKEVSSWDHYFSHHSNSPFRYRSSPDLPELTIKQKTSSKNNFNRVEINLPLHKTADPEHDLQVASALLRTQGYVPAFKIFKTCFIFHFGMMNYVYYLVYDENLKELGRFIEVEFSEEHAHHYTAKRIFKELARFEKDLRPLGITPASRLTKSLYETYSK